MLWHTVGIALVASAVTGAGVWRVQNWRHAAINAEAVEMAAETERLQRQADTRNAERNDRETSQALARAHASALAARGDLERLRHAAGAVASTGDAAAPGCSDDGRLGRLAELLTEGAGLAEEGGRRVEQLAAEKAALQRHAAQER